MLLNSFIEISFGLPVEWSDASDTDELLTSSTLASLGGCALSGTLTFTALTEDCDLRDSWRFTPPTDELGGGSVSTSAGFFSVRLPLRFATEGA